MTVLGDQGLSLKSTCQFTSERRVLDSEVPGSITGGNILLLELFFHVVKPLIPILTLLPISSSL